MFNAGGPPWPRHTQAARAEQPPGGRPGGRTRESEPDRGLALPGPDPGGQLTGPGGTRRHFRD